MSVDFPFLHRVAIAVVATASFVAGASGEVAAGSTVPILYRIFLDDGGTLTSYGDYARVSQRVVLSLPVASFLPVAEPRTQLVSISAGRIDWTNTERYADAASVWPFRTAADDDERLRDLEESKRLLYVAATRARDRLYFSAVTDGDRIKINRGSLGEVLPTAFVSTMERAIGADGAFEWVGQSGHAHRFAVLGAPTDPAPKNPSRIRNTV